MDLGCLSKKLDGMKLLLLALLFQQLWERRWWVQRNSPELNPIKINLNSVCSSTQGFVLKSPGSACSAVTFDCRAGVEPSGTS